MTNKHSQQSDFKMVFYLYVLATEYVFHKFKKDFKNPFVSTPNLSNFIIKCSVVHFKPNEFFQRQKLHMRKQEC